MAFRLPANLTVGQQYELADVEAVSALESSLPASSRVLVALTFSQRYDGFEADCERANEALLADGRFSTWSDYPRFVTPDPDGEPVAWISYLSSPAWWTLILLILGPIFLLPILGGFGMWITDLIFPGFTDLLTMGIVMFVMFLIMKSMTKSLTGGEEKK